MNWGQPQDIQFQVDPEPDETIRAIADDETLTGSSAGPDTLVGGFDGDFLEGNSRLRYVCI